MYVALVCLSPILNVVMPVSLCLFEPPSHPPKYMKMYSVYLMNLVVIEAKVKEGFFSRVEEGAPSLKFAILIRNWTDSSKLIE
jgi:hypothetical protein